MIIVCSGVDRCKSYNLKFDWITRRIIIRIFSLSAWFDCRFDVNVDDVHLSVDSNVSYRITILSDC